jgi:predicted RNase H-like HicB family nuclease
VSGERVQIVVIDHKRNRTSEQRSAALGMIVTEYPFSAHVLENPTINGRGDTEEEAVEKVKRALLTWNTREPGQTRKIVEIDVADEMIVRDVMEE